MNGSGDVLPFFVCQIGSQTARSAKRAPQSVQICAGTFLTFLNSKSQLRESVEHHLVGQVRHGGAPNEEADLSELLRKVPGPRHFRSFG